MRIMIFQPKRLPTSVQRGHQSDNPNPKAMFSLQLYLHTNVPATLPQHLGSKWNRAEAGLWPSMLPCWAFLSTQRSMTQGLERLYSQICWRFFFPITACFSMPQGRVSTGGSATSVTDCNFLLATIGKDPSGNNNDAFLTSCLPLWQ